MVLKGVQEIASIRPLSGTARKKKTAQIAVAFAVGIIFALGLAVSEMINPARVIGFLDVTGRWDPTLLLAMAGALAATIPGFPLILRRPTPDVPSKVNLAKGHFVICSSSLSAI